MKWIQILILVQILCEVVSWTSTNAFNSLKEEFNGDLIQPLMIPINYNNVESLLVFGGYSNNSFNNNLYQVMLPQNNIYRLGINSPKYPTNFNHCCGSYANNTLFIYGKNENFIDQFQFWGYNLTSQQWFVQNITNFGSCPCEIKPFNYNQSNETIISIIRIFEGVTIMEYSIKNKEIIKINAINIKNTINSSIKLWNGSIVDSSYIVLNQKEVNQNSLFSNSTINFPVKNFCIMNSSLNNINQYDLITNNGIFTIKRQQIQYSINYFIVYKDEYNEQNSLLLFKCLSVQDWQFLVYGQLGSTSSKNIPYFSIKINYKNIPNNTEGVMHSKMSNFYPKWPNQSQSYQVFAFKNAIYYVNHDFTAFYLNKTCDNSMAEGTNVMRCVYGMYSCQKDYTGSTCNDSICSNTLRILDNNDLSFINVQCSGNGKCKAGKCDCDINWTGDFCQIYENKLCNSTYGNSVKNFVLSNCQCNKTNKTTIGGNNCSVLFCYNDCSNNGQCKDGTCKCQQRYTGPDCSITLIGFDLI